jgi:hypothetical protein
MSTITIEEDAKRADFVLESEGLKCVLRMFPMAHCLFKGPLQTVHTKQLMHAFLNSTVLAAKALVDLLQTSVRTRD